MKRLIERVEVNMEELYVLLERAKTAPLTEAECATIKGALETLGYLTQLIEDRNTTLRKLRQIIFGASTEKMRDLLKRNPEIPPSEQDDRSGPKNGDSSEGSGEKPQTGRKPKGHGRNGAGVYTGATKIKVEHESLNPGDTCPGCAKGKLYASVKPGFLVRIVGQAPVGARVYEIEKLRCNLCLEIFTAKTPEGVGDEKYDATSGSMIALLKYGSGVPFNRLENLQGSLEIPLPASTQWDIVQEVANDVAPAHNELIRQAAQGEVLHNDDTTAKILALMKDRDSQEEPGEKSKDDSQRTGIFTTGIVSISEGRKIALFFTGQKHAGENLSDVLAQRAADLGPPIQMCDALSRNPPGDFEVLLANCNAHGRRKFVDVFGSFPAECRYVIEILAEVYRNDAHARKQGMSPAERLAFHQSGSGPLMASLEKWLDEQITESKVEPNSGLGKAISYLKNHWEKLTLFLRVPGAPLDNNICERALKRAILHRKNALFFKTVNGAHVGDIFMSLIHTCELSGANPFEYLTELQRNTGELVLNPKDWMPWNYRETLNRNRPDALSDS